jgi:2-phosphosulfolactate phosphatase
MKLASYSTQSAYAVRCEWGAEAIRYLAPECDAIVIVDVLSFSTCVDVAVSRGAAILPHAFRDERAADYAREKGALLASHERAAPGGYSVSPASLTRIDTGTRLVLPSPNGATLSLLAAETGLPTFAGCLRNAGAVAAAASRHGERVLVVPGGERWPGGTLRPSLEDWLGAGAIIHALEGERSPEAASAEQAFLHARSNLPALLRECASGRELIERGFGEDVEIAGELNASGAVPLLHDAAYSAWKGDGEHA